MSNTPERADSSRRPQRHPHPGPRHAGRRALVPGRFTLRLRPSAADAKPYQFRDWLFVALALVNLIAFARMSYAWHRSSITRPTMARRAAAPARPATWCCWPRWPLASPIWRASAAICSCSYALLDGKNDTVFFACLTALMALIWLPVLYALAGGTVPAARRGHRRIWIPRRARGDALPRWPLMLRCCCCWRSAASSPWTCNRCCTTPPARASPMRGRHAAVRADHLADDHGRGGLP